MVMSLFRRGNLTYGRSVMIADDGIPNARRSAPCQGAYLKGHGHHADHSNEVFGHITYHSKHLQVFILTGGRLRMTILGARCGASGHTFPWALSYLQQRSLASKSSESRVLERSRGPTRPDFHHVSSLGWSRSADMVRRRGRRLSGSQRLFFNHTLVARFPS